jgi:hypothetical protein
MCHPGCIDRRLHPPPLEQGWSSLGAVEVLARPENVVDLHAEAKRKECQVSDLRVTLYGMKEFEVRDPDGHILWFGQETNESPTSEGQSG